MVKNREWEKIFDILDQGTIEKISTQIRGPRNCLISCPIVSKVFPDTWGIHGLFVLTESFIGSILKDKLGVLTKEEFEDSLKQNGFEENDLDAERNGSFLWEFYGEKSEQIFDSLKYKLYFLIIKESI